MCKNPNSRLLCRLILDIFILIVCYCIALIVLPLLLKTNDTSRPDEDLSRNGMQSLTLGGIRRGFFCNDPTLSFPYRADTLVNRVHMTIIVIALPAATILIIEMLRAAFLRSKNANSKENGNGSNNNSSNSSSSRSVQQFSFVGLQIPTFISECYKILGVYLFGLALELIITQLSQHWVGRLRPYFFDICQPQMISSANGIEDTNTTSTCQHAKNQNRYVTTYHCSELAAISSDLVNSLHKSFPSDYVASASYALLFIIFYLESRLYASSLNILRIVLQFACAALISLVALERISKTQNHLSDVLAGLMLGFTLATFIVFGVAHLFRNGKSRNFFISNSRWESEPQQSYTLSSFHQYQHRKNVKPY